MAEAVLDSSAILAVLNSEPGADRVIVVMPRSLVSVANEAEVITVLIRSGSSAQDALTSVANLSYLRVDLDTALAQRAGTLWREVKSRGLSLGDRCCLALAEREKLPVLTGDKQWSGLSLGVEVHLFR